MLSPDFTYLSFDFETTGLDTRKDEPIQIGIVKFDHQFQIIDTYSSLIKPRRPIKELKSIVTHLTGFSVDQLKDAPAIEEILPDICKIFGGYIKSSEADNDLGTSTYVLPENLVIVGHNISFDHTFLSRYISYTPAYMIDTYIYAKALLHYIPSYALDVLNEHLKTSGHHRDPATNAYTQQNASTTTYHDALYDSYLAYNLFHKLILKVDHLRRKHPLVDYAIQKNTGALHDLIDREGAGGEANIKLSLPPLSTSVAPGHKKLIKDAYIELSQIDHLETADVSDIPPSQLISNIDWGKKKRIISTTHRPKVTILERAFKQIHIPTNTLHDQVVFDPARVRLFLEQETLTDAETLFLLKYHSQYDKQHTLLDINAQQEYTIFGALSRKQDNGSSRITICTHDQLFSMAHKITADHHLLYLDKDQRYNTYQRVVKEQFDPLYLLNHLEQISYTYTLISHPAAELVDRLYTLSIFLIAAINIETNPFFRGGDIKNVTLTDIAHDSRFPKTTALTHKFETLTADLSAQLLPEDHDMIVKTDQLIAYLTGHTLIAKRMYSGDKRYYTFARAEQYVSRDEFTTNLPPAGRTTFLGNLPRSKLTSADKRVTLELPKNSPSPKDKGTSECGTHDTCKLKAKQRGLGGEDKHISTNTNPKRLTTEITQTDTSCFVLSSSKDKSRQLYDHLIRSGVGDIFEICVENITGGVGKNLYRASISDKPILMVGGYNFCLCAIAKPIQFDHLYLYHLHGKMAPIILSDIVWWWGV